MASRESRRACDRLALGVAPDPPDVPILRPFRHAFVFRQLVRRDLQSRYAGSFLGFFWSFVHPLWQLALFTFIFSGILRVPLPAQGTERFAVFLFAGLLPWLAFQETLMRATTSISDNAALVKRVSFPSELIVLSIAAASLVQQAVAALVFAVVLVGLGEMSWSTLPWLIPALLLQAPLTVGLGLLLAAIHVFLRDTAQGVAMVLSGWFYLTPIVYPAQLVPETWRHWLDLNPLTALVGLYRTAFLGAPLPGGRPLGVLAAVAAVASLAGVAGFRRWRARFPDEI